MSVLASEKHIKPMFKQHRIWFLIVLHNYKLAAALGWEEAVLQMANLPQSGQA